MFGMLSDPTRLRILRNLRRGKPMNVTEICQAVQQSQPGASHHLSLLRHAGLVESARNGKNNYYNLTVEAEEAFGTIFDMLPDDDKPKAKPKTSKPAVRAKQRRDSKGKVIRDAKAPEPVEVG
jgi:DNA-binding transcriptional ArsR family regulator